MRSGIIPVEGGGRPGPPLVTGCACELGRKERPVEAAHGRDEVDHVGDRHHHEVQATEHEHQPLQQQAGTRQEAGGEPAGSRISLSGRGRTARLEAGQSWAVASFASRCADAQLSRADACRASPVIT